MASTVAPKYVYKESIGSGAFGKTYIGKDAEGNKVAIKVIPKNKTTPEAYNNELKILRKFSKPCQDQVVCFEDYGEDEKNYYFATEYFPDSTTLSQYIYGTPSLDYHLERKDEAAAMKQLLKKVEIICNLLNGIRTIHLLDIIHFDIKPDNIIVNPETAAIKYIDFGLSCIKPNCDRFYSHGTPIYMAPEIQNPISTYVYDFTANRATDLYSLGATIFELLTSRTYYHVYESKTPVTLKTRMGDRLYDFINEHMPSLLTLLSHLLSINPLDRLHSDSSKLCPTVKKKRFQTRQVERELVKEGVVNPYERSRAKVRLDYDF